MAFDITTLDETQLAFLATIDPDEVRRERARRAAYETMEEALTEVAQAALEVENFLASIKNTAATKAVKDSGLLQKINRMLATARNDEIEFKEPHL